MEGVEPKRGKFIGQRVKRVEDPRFLTGEARYIADLPIAHCLSVAFLRSPHGHAEIRSIDTSRAAAMPGVVRILTASDLESLPPLEDKVALAELKKTPQLVIAKGRVRFVGEIVAAVLAHNRYVAEDAADRIDVEYDPLPAVTTVEQALDGKAPLLHDPLGDNIVYQKKFSHGDVAKAFAAADHVFKATYRHNRFMAASMETRGYMAHYERASGRLTAWGSTQAPHMERLLLSSYLGIPEHKIHYIVPEVGGGFGLKFPVYPEEVITAVLSRMVGQPVRWIEDRREHLTSSTHAKEQIIDLEVAVKSDGALLGMKARCIGDAGAYSFNSTSALIEPMVAGTMMPGIYKLNNYDYEVMAVVTNKTPVGPYRGIGWTAGNSAREMLFDEIARALHIDRADFRRQNMIEPDDFPYTTCTGSHYDQGSYQESLNLALKEIGYADFLSRQAELRGQGRYLGIGFCAWVEQSAWGTDAAAQSGLPAPSHDNVSVRIDPSGKVVVSAGISSHGQGLETTLAQLAAEVLGVKLEDVRIVHGDTDSVPFGMGTYASRSAVIGGGALQKAATQVREKLLKVAGQLLEADPQDLVLEGGRVSVAGVPAKTLSMADIAGAAYFLPSVRTEGSEWLAATCFYDPKATYSNGCCAVIAEVDVETGVVKLQPIVTVEDCGTVLNPMIVEGQTHGAIAQAIGAALLEDLHYDETGQLTTTTYMDYLLPTTTEVPNMRVLHLETPSPWTVMGIKGMGEGGLIGAPAAVINAVVDALAPFGVEARELPLSPDRIFRLLRAAQSRPAAPA